MRTTELKRVIVFVRSAGVLLLGLSVMSATANCTTYGSLQPYDPVLVMPVHYSSWLISALEWVVAMVCLFGKRISFKLGLVFWVAAHLTYWYAPGRIITGSLDNIGEAFGVSTHFVGIGLWIACAYLLGGSCTLLFWQYLNNREERWECKCANCGATIAFRQQSARETIECPKCETAILLEPQPFSTNDAVSERTC